MYRTLILLSFLLFLVSPASAMQSAPTSPAAETSVAYTHPTGKKPGLFQQIRMARALRKALAKTLKDDPDGPPNTAAKWTLMLPFGGFFWLVLAFATSNPIWLAVSFLAVLVSIVLYIILMADEPNKKSRAFAKAGLILDIIYGSLFILGGILALLVALVA